MKQKALNVAVALAFGAVAAPSLAGTTSVTPRQFPSSIFGNPALSVAPVAYAISAPLAAGVTRYLYVRIDNSSKFAAGSVLAGDFKITDPAGNDVSATNGNVIGTPVLSADSTFFYVPITTGTVPVAINSTIAYTPEAGAVTNTKALATPGQAITATVSLGNNPSTTFQASDADSGSNGPVAQSVNPFTVTIVQSGASTLPFGTTGGGVGTEAQQIDVINEGAKNGILFTGGSLGFTTTAIDFGSFQVTLAPNLFLANGNPVVNATDVATKMTLTVSGQFPSFATTTTPGTPGFTLSPDPTNSLAANNIAASTISASTISFTNIPIANAPAAGAINAGTATVPGTQYYFDGVTDGNTLISSTTPTVSSVTFSGVGGTSTSTPTATTLYALTPNGGIVTVPTYVPAATGGGYVSYYRVINIGTLTATPSVAVIQENGVSGTPASLGVAIPPAGVHIFSSSDIEAAVGAVSASTRPRLRFTATTQIRVQSLLTNPGGTLTTIDSVTTTQN